MADNVVLNSGSGGSTIATDDIGGIQHQLIKVEYGDDGSAIPVSLSYPLPVVLSTGSVIGITGATSNLGVTGSVYNLPGTNIIGGVTGSFYPTTQAITGSIHLLPGSNMIGGVTGTFWQNTQSITGSIYNLAGTNIIGGVTGTFYPTTQAVTGSMYIVPGSNIIGGVTGTFYQTIQPVTGSVYNLPGTNIIGGVTGNFYPTTQAVTGSVYLLSGGNILGGVTGVFWQVTQPVSIANNVPITGCDLGVTGTVGLSSSDNTIGNMSLIPRMSGGLSYSSTISIANSPNLTQVKSGVTQVYNMYITNTNILPRYIKVYDKASGNVVVGTTTPDLNLLIPANIGGAGFHLSWSPGIAFTGGMSYILTTGAIATDTGAVAANEIIANVFYK